MQELLRTIVAGLVEDPSAIAITADDMGRVIGKQGRIARAIRIIMRSGAAKSNQKIAVEID